MARRNTRQQIRNRRPLLAIACSLGVLLAFTAVFAAAVGSEAGAKTETNAPANTTEAGAEPLRWRELVATINSAIIGANTPAAALVVVEDGKVAVVHGFGSATANTPFRLGSITKTFTALAVLQAAAATNTPLDTPLATIMDSKRWRARQQNLWHRQAPVTLAQLIELSAGFADISGAEFASAKPIKRSRALRRHQHGHTTHWPPGLQHSYSNLAPAYSAEAVEALTGKSFSRYLQQQVLQPLGMPNATLQPLAALPGGFKADGTSPIPYWHVVYPAFGGLNATPAEFAGFLARLSSGSLGEVLARAIQHRGDLPLYEPTSTLAAHNGLTLGYGAGIYGSIRDSQLVFGHGGDADGYRSRFGIIPAAGRGYFIAINTDNPALLRRLQALTERALIADVPAPAMPDSAQLSSEDWAALKARFSGRWYPASSRFGIDSWRACDRNFARLTVTNKQLLWHRGTRTQQLLPVSKRLFRRSTDPVATVVLLEDNSEHYLQGELGNWRRVPEGQRCTLSAPARTP